MGRPDKRKQVLGHLRNERHGNLGISKVAFERAEAKERGAQKAKETQDKAKYGDDDTKDGQDSSGFVEESSKSSNERLSGVKCYSIRCSMIQSGVLKECSLLEMACKEV